MIGDKEHPVRCSRLASLVKCSMRVYLLGSIEDEDDSGGPSAQTGSVVHAGVAEFHRNSNESLSIRTQKGWDAIAKAMAEFPLAEKDEVRLFFQPYINDPRNIDAIIPLWFDGTPAVEKQIDFILPPHEIDKTQQPIHVQGTFDHIRMDILEPKLYDLKTGKKTGWEMIHDYLIQMCAYTYGIKYIAQHSTFLCDQNIVNVLDRIKPGKIIRNYGYRQIKRDIYDNPNLSPDGVFWKIPYTINLIEDILENVRMHIGLYRNGYIQYGVGPHCTYCEHGGILGCTDKYEQLVLKQSS
jgi:hypothetical protein